MSIAECSPPVRTFQPQSTEDWRQARRLVEEYASSLKLDLSFQNFAEEVEQLSAEYGPPKGAFLLAEMGGALVGCVGVRPFSESVGEVKRLYVVPRARGHRIGQALVQGIVAAATQVGYERVVLDTLPSMQEAQSLYRSLGFRTAAPYRWNPIPGATFLELALR